MTRYLFPTFLLFLSACADLPTGRTYLSEMEHDDSTFYRPDEDFPVVGGDAEVSGMSMDEYRRNRLPRTSEEKSYDREGQLLRAELQSLESSQHEDDLALYQKYKKKFEKAKILLQLRERQAFTKPSVRRRNQVLKAVYKQQIASGKIED